jgi:serine/threonine-protein kinase HipA
MNAFDIQNYQPSDTLYLWWLGRPERPWFVGELRVARQTRGVSLVYGDAWLRSGFALSEDLPLLKREFFPLDKETAAGAVDDARPDRWGERVIRVLDKPARLSVLDFLFYAGDERFGALGVSVSPDQYLARGMGPLPLLADAQEIEQLVQQILAGEPVDEQKRRLIAPGATLGGARPKALLNIDGQTWLLKFNEPFEPIDMPLVEHAAMTLARRWATSRCVSERAVPTRLWRMRCPSVTSSA